MKMVNSVKKAFWLLGILLCLSFCKNNNVMGQTASPVPIDPKIKTGKLPNGFTYYLRKNKTPEGRATMYLVNKVGSILETDQQQGLAHFLEHMAFNGTKHFPKNELEEYLQKSGVRFGADLNAYTSFDETVYQLPIGTTDKTIFRNAMQVMVDWAQGQTLDDAEIDKEKGVVLSEKRQRSGAGERVQQQLLPAMLNDSRYANRIPIGMEEVLRNFDHKEIKQFYHDWYRPDLQALVIVGDINVDAVEKMIRNDFSGLKNPEQEKERTIYTVPLEGKNQYVVVTDPEIPSMSVELSIKHAPLVIRTDADYRQDLLRDLFNIMAADRMNEILQQGGAPFISASFSIGSMLGNLDQFYGKVTAKPNAVKEGVEAWWKELERIRQYGFTETELQRAKLDYTSNLEVQYKERDNRGSDSYMQQYVNHFLHGEATPGIEYEYQLYKSIIGSITTAEMLTMIQAYTVDKNRDINVVAGTNLLDVVPQEETMTAWMQDAKSSPLAAYADSKTERSKLMEQLPVPGTLVSETKGADGTSILMLSNGIRVILKPTNIQKGLLSFRSYSYGGLSQVSDADFYSASIAAGLIKAGGISDLSPTALRRMLTGKTLAVAPYISETMQGFTGQTETHDLETALQLVYLYTTKPRKDPVAFNRFIESARLEFESATRSPLTIFQDTVEAVLGNYHFRKMEINKDGLNKIDQERATAVYRDRFADANGTTFLFVGSFEEENIKPLLLQYLGSLPSQGRKEEIQDLHLNFPAGRITKKITAGTENKAAVEMIFGGPFTFDAYTVEQLNALADVITYRLIARLREEEGGVYTVNARPTVRKYPTGEYSITITFVCDPKKVDLLILSATEELMKLKTEGPSEDDIAKYKATSKSSLDRAKQSNQFWLGYLTTQLSDNEKTDVADLQKRIEKVNAENVQKAAQTFINYANFITVTLKPVQ